MKEIFKKYNLQFFAESVPSETEALDTSAGVEPVDAGQDAGVIAADAGQMNHSTKRSLEELGVPKDKAEKYRARKAKSAPAAVTIAAEEKTEMPEQAAAAEKVEVQQEKQEAYNWDEAMKSPEFKRRMSEIVTARVKDMQDRLDAMAPALELLGRRAGMDVTDLNKLDYAALNKAVVDDDSLYESSALAAGEDVSTYKRNMQREMEYSDRERRLSRKEADFEATLEQIAVRNYQNRIQADAAELKKEFPNFDLEKEMENPRFKAMVAPGGGFTLADAYYAIHRSEIRAAIETETAQRVQKALTRSFQSGRQIPAENGSRNNAAAPVGNKLYSQMTKEERAIYKADLQRRSR